MGAADLRFLRRSRHAARTGTFMSTQRRSYETGHKPKCLVIVDDSAEWDRAVYYASRWAIRYDGGVVMLRIIETEDQNQQWLGVAGSRPARERCLADGDGKRTIKGG